jgi:hypothetical protein
MEWSGNAMTTPRDVKEPQPACGESQASADAELKGSLAAIRRAAIRARQIAQQTGTDLIVMRAGRVMRISPSKKQP